jgi:hypothetical protein
MTWTLQGLWVTAAAAWAAITSDERQELGLFALANFLEPRLFISPIPAT